MTLTWTRIGIRLAGYLGVAMTVGASPIPKSPGAEGDAFVSRAQIAGVDFVATVGVASGWVETPDLSQPGSTPIPREATFRAPLPVLWGTRILPVGEFLLSLAVGTEGELDLELRAVGSVTTYTLPVERADFSAPEDVRVSVSGTESDDRVEGALQVRWGAILLEGRFTPLRSTVHECDVWRLHSYSFPPTLVVESTTPLGELELSQDSRKWRVTLLDTNRDRARLLIEDRSYLKLLDERAAAQRDLVLVRRRMNRATGDELDRLRRKETALEARSRVAEERLARASAEPTSREIPATALAQPNPLSGLEVRLVSRGEETVLAVTTAQRRFEFVLPES